MVCSLQRPTSEQRAFLLEGLLGEKPPHPHPEPLESGVC